VENPNFPIGGFSTLRELRAVLEELKQHFHLVPLNAILSGCSCDHELPIGTLTLDDGLDAFQSGIFDLINDLEIPSTCFVVTSCIGNRIIMWQHRLKLIEARNGLRSIIQALNTIVQIPNGYPVISSAGEIVNFLKRWPPGLKEEFVEAVWTACNMPSPARYLEYRPYMEWEDLELWLAAGHEVGLHTASHPFCSQLDEDALEAELVTPACDLIRRCGQAQIPVSYPFGDRPTPRIEKNLASRGMFSCLLGISGPSRKGCSPFALERMSLECGIDDGVFGRGLIRTALNPIHWNRR
jgi:hypothetical protein